jgi:hypothetical protein
MGQKEFEVWIEGSSSSDGTSQASRLLRKDEIDSRWKGITFQQAVVRALNELKWQMLYEGSQGCGDSYYDRKTNSYWACKFYDNEIDARKSFG